MILSYKGSDYAKALKTWVDDDIKSSALHRFELGKFFFTVSIATVGAVTALIKGNGRVEISVSAAIFFALMLISLLLPLFMVLPRERELGPSVDLQEEHKRQVQWTIDASVAWFVVWIIGVIFGGAAIFV